MCRTLTFVLLQEAGTAGTFASNEHTMHMRHFLLLAATFGLLGTAQGQTEWNQMSSCPGAGRFWATATGNNTTAIAGTGRLQFSGVNNTVADMWRYDAPTDTWSEMPTYPGGVREGADAFTIGERLFVGFGSPFIQFTNDLYEYIPSTNSWVQMPSVPGVTGFAYSHGFVIGNSYYIGPENGVGTVYAFNADTETWSTVAPFPGEDRRAQCAFSAGGKGYLGMGAGVFSGVYGDWWEYDPLADTWTEVASISPVSDQSTATQVNDRGYVFNVGGNQRNLHAYDVPGDEWLFQSTLPTDRIANGTLFSIGGQGYLVFGQKTVSGGNFSSNELWRFSPINTGVGEVERPFGLQATAMADGTLVLRSHEPLVHAAQLDVLDGIGRTVHTTGVSAGAPVQLVIPTAGKAGLRLVRLRSAAGVEVLRVVVE